MLGHYRHASETRFKWRFSDEPMIAHFLVVFGSPHQLQKSLSMLDHLCQKIRIRAWTHPSERVEETFDSNQIQIHTVKNLCFVGIFIWRYWR